MERTRLSAGPLKSIICRASIQDCLVLCVVVVLTFALYVNGLGFYSDDWAFLQILSTADRQSFIGFTQALYDNDIVIRQRPVQIVYLAGIYRLFGAEPAAYHVTNIAVFAGIAVFFYLALRELRLPRMIAFALPLLYVSLPHYSTDRFWVAAHQANISMLFYFLSLYCGLRAARSGGISGIWRWNLISVGALVLSALAYEVAMPLLALHPLLYGYILRDRLRGPAAEHRRLILGLLGSHYAALAALVAFKLLVTVRAGVEESLLAQIRELVVGNLVVNYGTYGAGLPYVLWWVARNSLDAPLLLAAGAAGLLIFGYLRRISDDQRAPWPARRWWAGFGGAGFVVLGLGYAIFLFNDDIWFTSTSLGNRIAIAAAVGIAMSYIGAIGWLASSLRDASTRRTAFNLALSLLWVSGFVIVSTLGEYWVEASERQQEILDDIALHVDGLPQGSVLILDGACLEHGGAYLFTGKRDLASVLQMRRDDPSLWATAVTNPVLVGPEGLTVTTYGTAHFPYDDSLIVYDYRTKTVAAIPDQQAASGYFEASSFDPGADCPPGFAWGLNE